MSKEFLTLRNAGGKLDVGMGLDTYFAQKATLVGVPSSRQSLLLKYGDNEYVVDDDIQKQQDKVIFQGSTGRFTLPSPAPTYTTTGSPLTLGTVTNFQSFVFHIIVSGLIPSDLVGSKNFRLTTTGMFPSGVNNSVYGQTAVVCLPVLYGTTKSYLAFSIYVPAGNNQQTFMASILTTSFTEIDHSEILTVDVGDSKIRSIVIDCIDGTIYHGAVLSDDPNIVTSWSDLQGTVTLQQNSSNSLGVLGNRSMTTNWAGGCMIQQVKLLNN